MATVTTPNGVKIENVSGSELDYYRGEANTQSGWTIDEEQAVTFPRVFDGEKYVGEEPAAEPVVTEVDQPGAGQPPAEVLPEGQYRASDGIVYDASGAAVDPQPEPPAA